MSAGSRTPGSAIRGGEDGSAERSATEPRERGLSRIGSSHRPASSPSGSLTQNMRSGAPSAGAVELRSVAIECRTGPPAATPAPAGIEVDAGVVREVRADAREIDQRFDPHRSQVARGTDARPHQDRRAAVGAGRDDDPAGRDVGAIDEANAGRPGPYEVDRRHGRVGADLEARGPPGSRQVRVGGRDANAVVRAHRQPADADGGRRVVVLDRRDAHAHERLDCSGMDRRLGKRRIAGDGDQTGVAVPRLGAELRVGLEATERGQHVREAPARIASRRPGIEVGGRSPDGEAGEPRGAAQEPAAAQLGPRAGVAGLGLEPPVGQRRQVPPVVPFRRRPLGGFRPGLEKNDPLAQFGQAPRDHAAGRAAADDRDIERRRGVHRTACTCPVIVPALCSGDGTHRWPAGTS